MKPLLALLILTTWLRADAQSGADVVNEHAGQEVETIVCIRHGEKPTNGLGQLTCRGLNRALALPDVLLGKYGTPQFVFAPATTQKKDSGVTYNYIRPLMTIEPTAVRCGLPVNTQIGYEDIQGLETEVEKPSYESATLFVAWEHSKLDDFVKDLVKNNGGTGDVPAWGGNDYDSIFVVKITRHSGHKTVSFRIDHEGLNNLSEDCPGAAAKGK